MIRVECRTGRLVELQTIAPVSLEDVDASIAHFVRIFTALSTRVVACVDLRRSPVLDKEASARFLDLLKRDNPRIERSALLVAPGTATLALQVDRMIREANNPARRMCRSLRDVEDFLHPVLNVEEKARLASFLSGL